MTKFTQNDFDNFPLDNCFKICPSGDYTDIKVFGDWCSFGDKSRFRDGCSFGKRCNFCEGCTFGQKCIFGDNCNFGESCMFCEKCKFGDNCIFGERCTFGELCKLGKDWKLVEDSNSIRAHFNFKRSNDFEILENTCTAWELQREYGINKQKTCLAIRSGKINGFMKGTNEFVLLKWYIKCDELLEKWIKDNKR